VVGFTDPFVGGVSRRVDDFVLRRADGVAAYNLAVVVDDADQGVDQVVRGDDLIDTTPRQILLQRLLGIRTPDYLHVPLVVGVDGERLAKRHGAVTLSDLRAEGMGPARVLGRLARSIGITALSAEPTIHQVLDRFDLTRLPREPAVWEC
jgi:glutamyl-tRNA synthetase